MNSKEIRQKFFDFFESKNHKIVESAPMVIKNDPTLMFTNAGMNQFKDIFLGNKPVKYPRIADSQKCLRVSGKHNDLEEVGHDTYHHTMFEMLGNWSFGDYFKKEAIAWASEFLLKEMGLDKSRMYATVFEGDEKDGVEFDTEAYDYWKEILPESHILKGNKKDNFWEMGETGPCGPCSELHYDLREQSEIDKIAGAELVNKDNPLVIEIWNLVFMQYNRKANGSLELLPAQHVDTGMGFERLCMIIQNKKSNYDTDVFQCLIQELAKLCGKEYGKEEKTDIAMRVIADHIRAISFSIADGQLPSNVKAGYVIRRILRRAVRYGYTYLNFREPFMCKVVPTLVEQMGGQYPELAAQKELIYKIIEEEENSFLKTLSTGIGMLDTLIETLKKDNKTQLSGEDAFVLYDTYGFPLDLTELICKENSLTVNLEEFNKQLLLQKERSRNAASVETLDWVELNKCDRQVFVGYDTTTLETQIARYRTVITKSKKQYHIVLPETPFYGNSGGQVGDIGVLFNDKETIEVVDTIKENGLIILVTNSLPQEIDAVFTAQVSVKERNESAANHTATHLLQKALRKVLGSHVEQKGSLVTPKMLRFDFSHFQKMTDEEINEVIRLVNIDILATHKLDENRNCPIEEARKSGAMMLFGEKYDEVVRTVKFGDSFELCGGVHVHNTGEIGSFTILSEGAISAGVRRIEAVTGMEKINYDLKLRETFNELRAMLNTKSVSESIKKLMQTNSDLSKTVEMANKERNDIMKEKIKNALVEENGIQWYTLEMQIPANVIKEIATMLYSEIPNIAFIATTQYDKKPGLVVMFGKDCVAAGADANKIIKQCSKLMQGGGGGQANLASAGGKDTSKMGELIDSARKMAEDMLK